MTRSIKFAVLATIVSASNALAAPGTKATVTLNDLNGQPAGALVLVEEEGGVKITGMAEKLTPGEHGFHIHTTGECVAPFNSAGGHFNPLGKKHGIESEEGHHAGDLPNIVAEADGTAHIDVVAEGVTLDDAVAGLFDADGSSFVIHAGPDDHKTDPSGNSGDRVICGVVERQ